ncbi:MAG: endonuclease VIII [Anaerolineae bacterium]
MIELPEAIVIARQITETVSGKRIARAVANASPHKFAFYSGDPAEYGDRLSGKTVGGAQGVGPHIQFTADDMMLSISAPIRYHERDAKRPGKHQLLIEFDDGTAISAGAQMWGGFFCFPIGGQSGYPDVDNAHKSPSPLTDAFDRTYFDTLFDEKTPNLSAKAFLATEQRIPGLGNGVLQDILWAARIHPKRRMSELPAERIDAMYSSVKEVLAAMTAQGGRDTERDLFGHPGGYRTILSKNTVGGPCPACGALIEKQAYLGGSIYFCPGCQSL